MRKSQALFVTAAALPLGVMATPVAAEPVDMIMFPEDSAYAVTEIIDYETLRHASANTASIASPSSVTIQATRTSPTFILNNLGGVEPGSVAFAGFSAAAALWSAALTDDVTIRLDVSFEPLGPGILGSAGSTVSSVPVNVVRSALSADRTSRTDNSAVANIPGQPLSYVSNEPGTCPDCGPIDSTIQVIDSDNTVDNSNLQVNTSQLKALGLIGDVVPADGRIRFSSNFAFDFNREDGIASDLFDFIGVAAHEIGHVLGFRSGVDLVDNNALPDGGAVPPPRAGLDGIAYITILDLFRYNEFIDGDLLSMAVGGDPFLSFTGGRTRYADMSSGRFNGDGSQASHFQDNEPGLLSIGLLDPTAARGEPLQLTRFDLNAFDAIGWDLFVNVPEPGMLALFGLGAVGLMAARRRRAGA